MPADRVQDVGTRIKQRVADELIGVFDRPFAAQLTDQFELALDPEGLGVGQRAVEVP